MFEKKINNLIGKRMPRAIGGQNGYTLIEIIIVIVILGVIGAFTFQMVGAGVQAFKKSNARKDLYDQGRLALERMVRELRDTKEVTGSASSSITFKKAHPAQAADNTEEIKFELNGTNLERVGDPNGTPVTAVLASNVSSFTVTGVGTTAVGGSCSVVIDNVSSGTTVADTDTTMTVSHATGTGSKRLMLVGISFDNTDYETVTGVTYNGTALELVGARAYNAGDDARHEIWKLVNPDSGTFDVVINFSAALDNGAVAGVMTFTGVDQGDPYRPYDYAEGTDNTGGTLNVVSAQGELVYAVASAEYYSLTASTGQTEHWNISHSGADTNGAGGTATGASPTVPMGWSLTSGHNYWTIGGVSIKPSATGCAGNLVMVTQNGDYLSGEDNDKKTLFETWGWTVDVIRDSDGDYTGAAGNNDVMFISESCTSTDIGTQATTLDMGIFVEEVALQDEMEFSAAPQNYTNVGGTQIDIVDNSHYITNPFGTGPLTIYNSSDNLLINHQTVAAGAAVLADEVGSNDTAFVAFDTGDTLDDGSSAVNRRVGFWGMHTSNPGNWTSDMETLVRRSLDWVAGADGGNLATLEITLEDPNDSSNTVTMRTKVYLRNLP
jgi:prepilin-type N-terminal cleavage/methylation domain-containing protein